LTEALADYSEASRTIDGQVKALRRRAEVHFLLGRKDDRRADLEAYLKILRQALRANPPLWWAWYEAGNVHYELDNVLAAKECFARFLELSPKDSRHYQGYRIDAQEKLREIEGKESSTTEGRWE
jgi:tetratricopeptide (TPR) repeat protein